MRRAVTRQTTKPGGGGGGGRGWGGLEVDSHDARDVVGQGRPAERAGVGGVVGSRDRVLLVKDVDRRLAVHLICEGDTGHVLRGSLVLR